MADADVFSMHELIKACCDEEAPKPERWLRLRLQALLNKFPRHMCLQLFASGVRHQGKSFFLLHVVAANLWSDTLHWLLALGVSTPPCVFTPLHHKPGAKSVECLLGKVICAPSFSWRNPECRRCLMTVVRDTHDLYMVYCVWNLRVMNLPKEHCAEIQALLWAWKLKWARWFSRRGVKHWWLLANGKWATTQICHQ